MANGTGGGDWVEYRNLIVAELERLNKLLEDSRTDRVKINLEIDRLKLALVQIQLRLDRLDDDQREKSLITRVNTLEDSDLGHDAIKRYKVWLVSLVIALIGSIALPIVTIILTG